MKDIKIKRHFDKIANNYDLYKIRNSFYYDHLKKLLKTLILKNSTVLEIGCGTGDLISYLQPRIGYGMDVSSQMIQIAKSKHKLKKYLKFSTTWPSSHSNRFDYIFMSDVIEHLENPKGIFLRISKLMGKNTTFINTMANPVWEPILMFWEKMGWKMPEGPHKRITFKELNNITLKSGLKIVRHSQFLS